MSRIEAREICIKNAIPQQEITRLLTLKGVCGLIARLASAKQKPNRDEALIEQLEDAINKLESVKENNRALRGELSSINNKYNKLLKSKQSIAHSEEYVKEIQAENLEYRTRNNKLLNEINKLTPKYNACKVDLSLSKQTIKNLNKRLANAIKNGSGDAKKAFEEYRNELWNLKSTITVLKKGTASRDLKIRQQGSELTKRANEITRLKKSIREHLKK